MLAFFREVCETNAEETRLDDDSVEVLDEATGEPERKRRRVESESAEQAKRTTKKVAKQTHRLTIASHW